MTLFNDYIQPLTLWLYDHPYLALFIAFLISFSESLAIVGSIVPGSVTMTALGILAGAGVMRIDLTLLAASLGAIAGDSASYMLGYFYSDRLASIWPFRRYPNWLVYGKDYFARHGGKSVLIGRFVGPLRSIIPVIAGMMHMNHFRFYLANISSAIGWALLYVMPGVLIGTASSELSPEIATRLFIFILLALAGIWLISLGLKWLFIRANRLMKRKLNQFWLRLMEKPFWGRIAKTLTPSYENHHYPTAALFFLFILSSFLFFIIALLVYSNTGISLINQSTHLFFQSLRTGSFDAFFIIISQITSPLTLAALFFSIAFVTIFYRDKRSLLYWLSLCLFTVLILALLQQAIYSPRPLGIYNVESSSSFPIPVLTFVTAVGLTLFLYVNAYSKTRFKHFVTLAIAICLLLVGLTPLSLGDNWLTDILGAYLCGISLSLGHWLFYRRQKPKSHYPSYVPLAIVLLLILTTTISSYLNFKFLLFNHQPYFAQYVFTDELWWDQKKPVLPIYRTNRIGHRISVFNLQYAGSLANLEQTLKNHGWQKQTDSLLASLLARVSKSSTTPELPLLAQLYLNKKPALVMIYAPKDKSPVQILRIWRSNYFLEHLKQPIWIGSVHPQLRKAKITKSAKAISYISSALPKNLFLQRSITLPSQVSKQDLPEKVELELLLIKERTD